MFCVLIGTSDTAHNESGELRAIIIILIRRIQIISYFINPYQNKAIRAYMKKRK